MSSKENRNGQSDAKDGGCVVDQDLVEQLRNVTILGRFLLLDAILNDGRMTPEQAEATLYASMEPVPED